MFQCGSDAVTIDVTALLEQFRRFHLLRLGASGELVRRVRSLLLPEFLEGRLLTFQTAPAGAERGRVGLRGTGA